MPIEMMPVVAGLNENVDTYSDLSDMVSDLCFPQTQLQPGPFLARHLRPFVPTQPGDPILWTVKRRPVFQVGNWNDIEYTQSDIDGIVDSFPTIVSQTRPWITIHHRPRFDAVDLLTGKDGVPPLLPILGVVSSVYKNDVPFFASNGYVVPPGELVFSDWVNVAPGVIRAMKRRNFQRPSCGLEREFEDKITGRVWPWVMQHISLEGGQPEAVYTLEDLDNYYLERSKSEERKVASFSPMFQSWLESETRHAVTFSKRKVFTFANGGQKMPLNVAKWEDLVPIVSDLQEGQAQIMSGINEIRTAVGLPATKPPPAAVAPAAPAKPVENASEKTTTEVKTPAASVNNESAAATVTAPAPPAAPVAPVAPVVVPAAAVSTPEAGRSGPVLVSVGGKELSLEDLLQKAREEGKADVAKKVVELETQVLSLSEKNRLDEEAALQQKVSNFMRKANDVQRPLLPATIAPQVEFALSRIVSMESKAAKNAKNGEYHFARADGAKLLPSDIIMTIFEQAAINLTTQGSNIDLAKFYGENPVPPQQWNKKTVAEFTRNHAAKTKKNFSDAYSELADIYGQPFTNGIHVEAR